MTATNGEVVSSPGTGEALGADLRAVTWWVLVGLAAGAIAGGLVGGIGGRLAMLLLRLTSPEDVIGMTSDDGFEIGVFTFDTLQLVLAMAMLGGINGVLYAAFRGAIPPRVRLPLWSLFAAALGGANIVHEDGVDFTFLEPAALAVALFVAYPARLRPPSSSSSSAGSSWSRGRNGASASPSRRPPWREPSRSCSPPSSAPVRSSFAERGSTGSPGASDASRFPPLSWW